MAVDTFVWLLFKIRRAFGIREFGKDFWKEKYFMRRYVIAQ